MHVQLAGNDAVLEDMRSAKLPRFPAKDIG